MASITDLVRASRARKAIFSLPDGSEVTVPPPSLDQIIDCLRLDPAKDGSETPLEETLRLRRQAEVLIGPALFPRFAGLDAWQFGEVASTLYVNTSGLDAEAYARWQLKVRDLKTRQDRLEIIKNLEDASAKLAATLREFPDEVGARPLADILALRELLDKEIHAERKFEASVHGRTLE